MEQALYKLPEGWEWQRLGGIGVVIRGVTYKKGDLLNSITSDTITLLRANNIQETLDLSEVQLLPAEKIKPDKILLKEDILFCMSSGSKHLVGKNIRITEKLLDYSFGAFCSILRLKNREFSPFVALFLASSQYKNALLPLSKGAGINNLKGRDLEDLVIPLPPLDEQKRIVTRLDALFIRIDTTITHLQETLELTKALFASASDEMFSSERRQDEIVPLNKAAIVARGKSKHRPRNDKTLFGGDYPFIQTGDVRNASKYITTHSSTYNERGLAQSKLWPRGTICLTIAANIVDVAILGMDSCFPDSVVGITSESESNEYIYYFLMTLQRHLDSKANAAAQKNINLRILSEIEIPLPSLEEQNRIVTHLDALSERTRALEAATEEKLNELTALKASLLDAAFKGQL